MPRIFWSLSFLALMLSSCVPNKRIVYLQHDVEPKPDQVTNKDSLLRTYATRFQEYALRPGDVISINIGTLTPSEFDFIRKYEEDLGIVRKLNQYDQVRQGSGQQSQGGGMMGGGGGGGTDLGIAGAPTLSALMLDRQQTGFTIDMDGILELPKLGKLPLAGLSIPQAEKLLKEKLYGYFEAPAVRVQVLNFHFTILGEVNKEGRFTIFDPNANVFDAIAIAENLTDFADRSKIKIVRLKQNKASVLYVNALRENLLEQPGFFLQPDDLIIVPPLEARATRKYTLPTYTSTIGVVVSTLSLLLILANIKKL